MSVYKKYGNYDRFPHMEIQGCDHQVWEGWESLLDEIRAKMKNNRIFVFDLYPGNDHTLFIEKLNMLAPDMLIDMEDCVLPEEQLNALFEPDLTQDRVFGVMTHLTLADCFSPAKMEEAKAKVEDCQGVCFIVGVGAGLVCRGDVYTYCDLSRWESQLRYRRGMSNWHCTNVNAPQLAKYKRGFFIEWRLADRHKRAFLGTLDYLVDGNRPNTPVMVAGAAFRQALETAACRPFRVQPYFDPGVWGGQWMKQVFGLPEDQPNYAWSFDGVPEENSLVFRFGVCKLEIPCMDLVLYRPRQLLGERVHGRFGAEFPIRFDLLDTMGGENLSLQVHPLTEYIQEKFGMHYTQDESYYILDAQEGESCVYLGVKTGVDRQAMLDALEAAQNGGELFPAQKYVNCIPVSKHDHVLIPAGTIHCSGRNTMVLEISATPYIFTFKLWDWNRLGLDGLPRPVHLKDGAANIQWDRDTQWVEENLLGQARTIACDAHCTTEITGLHEREFIETRRYTFSAPVSCDCQGSVQMLNLVEGCEMTLRSPREEFEPFVVHYAETVIIPAKVRQFIMEPSGPAIKQEVKVIIAGVR